MCVLRLIFIAPGCFNHLQEKELQSLIKKLINFAIYDEEPLCTHAIKCLQVLAYSFAKKGKIIHRFDDLVNVHILYKIGVLIDRLIAMLDKCEENSQISVCNLLYLQPQTNDKSLDLNEHDETLNEYQNKREHIDLDISSYIDVGETIKLCSIKFHHIALINYIIPHVK
ncbi:hypothetical protein MXB_3847, partial [Myxobolus squamalis]